MTTSGFEHFATAQHPRLVGALTLLVGDRGVAEELAQDALVRAYERWDRVQAMAAPGPWIHRVAVNGGLSWLRRRSAERRALRRSGVADADTTDRAESLAVRSAVSHLPRRQREAVVYRYYLGYSTADTAELMGISEGSVKSAVTRAFTALRAVLDQPADHADVGGRQ